MSGAITTSSGQRVIITRSKSRTSALGRNGAASASIARDAPLDELLARLDSVHQTGDCQWEAVCPAHEDNRASLSISSGEDGRILLHCHAGCDPKDVVRGVNMEMKDLFPSSSGQRKGKKGRSWPQYNKDEVKRAMHGRWLNYFQELGLGAEFLSGKEGPCPWCPGGGDTRFRVLNAEEGVLFCSHCFHEASGDGIAALAKILGKDQVKDFPELLHLVAEFAGVSPIGNENSGSQASAEGDASGERAAMVAAMSPEAFLAAVCDAKKMPVKSALAYGAVVKNWGGLSNGGERVVEFPVYNEKGEHEAANRFGQSHLAGDELLHKGRFAKGAKHGLFLPHGEDSTVHLPRPGEMWVVVEGVKDAAALHGLGYNAVGLPTSAMNERFAGLFAGVEVVLVPDLDQAGQQGAEKTAKVLERVAASVKCARLPGELRDSGGDDVRDVLAKAGGETLVRLAIQEGKSLGGDAPPVEPIEVISSAEFFAADYKREFIVDGILTAGEPCVIGGQSKTLKTTLAVDLALAIGTGTLFLGRFEVKSRRRVVVLSGESGDYTLQETAKRIAKSRSIADVEKAEVYWGFDLPCLGSDEGIGQLMATIEMVEAELLIVDPAYLSLMGDATRGLNAGNIFDIGPLLLNLSRECKNRSLTLILLHHCRKNSPNEKFSPPELAELSMAGFGEFARQWILLGRREAYLCDGKHRLWFVVGGSAGHGGQWALDVDEGEFEAGSHRKYEVTLRTAVEELETKKSDKEAKAEAKKAAVKEERQRKVVDVMKTFPEGETQTQISKESGVSPTNLGPILHALLSADIAERCVVRKQNQEHDGWRLKPTHQSAGDSEPPNGQPRQPGQINNLSDRPADAGESDRGAGQTGDYINSPLLSALPPDSPVTDDPERQTIPDGQVGVSGSEAPSAVVDSSACAHKFIDKPSPGRPGWIRTECKLCGKWQGDRPSTATGKDSTANGRPRKEGAKTA